VSADGQSAAAAGPSEPTPTLDPPPSPAFEPPVPAAQQRPEVQVGVAFAGGLLAAIVLRRLGGRR
jgi:hypothetical protein